MNENYAYKLGTTLACLTLFLLIFLYSCKKEIEQSSADRLKLEEWYKANVKPNDDNDFIKNLPLWNRIYINHQDKLTIYEIELANPQALVMTVNTNTLKQQANKSNLRLLLFEDNVTKKIKYGSYMYIENENGQDVEQLHYKQMLQLNGRVVFYHLSGHMANGWIYEKGKPLMQIATTTEKHYLQMRQDKRGSTGAEKLMNAGDQECNSSRVDAYFWGCIGTSGVTTCGWHFKETKYITICRAITFSGDETTIDYLAPPDYGGYWPANIDCNGDENGSAFYTEECGCIGGNTGVQSCANITDKIKDKCLDSVWVKINGNLDSKIANILKNTFGTSDKINFKIVDGNIDGGYSAKTEVVIDKVNSDGIHVFDVKVTLNKNTLPSASQEFIATTMVHEIMHAYFDSQKTYYTQQFQQHRNMAENYIDDLKNAVQSIYSSLDDKAAYALILNGFGDIFKNDLTYWNTLVSKYDLDTAQIINIRDNYKSHSSGTKTACSQ